jgi:hypothetical protein
MIGFGKLELYRGTGRTLIIRNANNPYAADEKAIFGAIDDLPIDLVQRMVRSAFKRYFKKDVTISVMKNSVLESFIRIDVGP